jgi:hypothetical protein
VRRYVGLLPLSQPPVSVQEEDLVEVVDLVDLVAPAATVIVELVEGDMVQDQYQTRKKMLFILVLHVTEGVMFL